MCSTGRADGTFLPRLFFVRFGTGIGSGRGKLWVRVWRLVLVVVVVFVVFVVSVERGDGGSEGEGGAEGE
jgi:hypothetical protein